MSDLYKSLSVLPTATPAEIQAAYVNQRKALEERARADDPQAAELLKALEEAYAILADPSRRMAYDQSRADGTQAGALMVTTPAPPVLVAPAGPAPILQRACPHCSALNPAQAVTCGNCHQQISRPCPNCGQLNDLKQAVCSRCSTLIPEYDQRRFADGLTTGRQIKVEREEGEARVEGLETVHRTRAVQGVLFWAVVLVGCLGLPVIAVIVAYLLTVLQLPR
ncbi:MAG TPA: DnaJ domain-containing protein [Anaerolineales bacterium]|nr:DnaJ domain-containing protein [Anaerolineales bacterium]